MPGEELDPLVWGLLGGMASGYLRPFLAPADALHDKWQESWTRILRTAERTERKRQGRNDPITERTAVHALREAALTDEVIVQEYLAGAIASASSEEDNVHLLALVSRLTPIQLRLHYQLYLSAFTCLRSILLDDSWEQPVEYPEFLEHHSNIVFLTRLIEDRTYLADYARRIEPALLHLEREQLLNLALQHPTKTVVIEGAGYVAPFTITKYGVILFAAALGMRRGSAWRFAAMEEDSLQIEPQIPALTTRIWLHGKSVSPKAVIVPYIHGLFEDPLLPRNTTAKGLWQVMVGATEVEGSAQS